MDMHVVVGGRLFGNVERPNFGIQVSVPRPEKQTDGIDLEVNGRMKRLRAILLGKRSPRTVRVRGRTAPVIYRGETVSRLHLEHFADHFDDISFRNTPWERKIAAFREECAREDAEEGFEGLQSPVLISFLPAGKNDPFGQVNLSLAAARWLGSALIAASEGRLDSGGLEAQVSHDRNVQTSKLAV